MPKQKKMREEFEDDITNLLMIVISGPSTGWMYALIPSPIFTLISPAAQVALLHTEMYSGFRFPERIGIKSGN